MLETAESGLAEIIGEMDAGDESPQMVTERCVWEHNRKLLVEQLSRRPA